MADISRKITSKSLKLKRKAAIKTIKVQAKEKIHQVKMEYASDSDRARLRAAEKEHKKELHLQKANARLSYNTRQPRPFTLGEEIFNSISHGIGAGLSVAAIVLLTIQAYYHAPCSKTAYIASFSIFGSALFILFLMSTLYHAISSLGAKRIFSIINHDSIYIFIAAVYTPFVLTQFKLTNAAYICGLVWGICGGLVALYSVFGAKLRIFSFLSYVTFGWILIGMALSPLGSGIKELSKKLMTISAIIYTTGSGFFILKTYKWMHSVFHLCSLAASILMFFSIYYLAG